MDCVCHVALSTASVPPPGGAQTGDKYLIVAGSGAWNGLDDYVAEWDGAKWIYNDPKEGHTCFLLSTGLYYIWDGSTWVQIGEGGGDMVKDFFTEVSVGNIPGYYQSLKRGFIPSAAGGNNRLIWPYSASSSSTTPVDNETVGNLIIHSNSGQDDISGTGLQKVYVEWLDENWDRQTEIFDTNGGSFDTGYQAVRCNSFFGVQAGSNGQSQSWLEVRADSTMLSRIQAGFNGAHGCFCTVPQNHAGLYYGWSLDFSEDDTEKGAQFELYAKGDEFPLSLVDDKYVAVGTSWANVSYEAILRAPTVFPERTAIYPLYSPDQSGANPSAKINVLFAHYDQLNWDRQQ